jgi:hypothetical protein
MRIMHFVLGVLLAVGLLASGCGSSEWPLTGTSRAAGADGKVKVEKIEGSYIVKVELEHLPPPGRLGNGLAHYILWLQPQNQQPQREAVLQFDEGARSGRATATTPIGNFTLIVTAERTVSPTSPSDVVVARRQINP